MCVFVCLVCNSEHLAIFHPHHAAEITRMNSKQQSTLKLMCVLTFLPTVDVAKSRACSFVNESAKAGKKQNIVLTDSVADYNCIPVWCN